MIVMLLSCSKSWCQTDISLTGDSVKVSIVDIRIANHKLIKAKYDAERLIVKDSIIHLQMQRYDALNAEVKGLQGKLITTKELNNSLKKDIDKANKRNRVLSGISGGAIAAFVVCLFLR